MTDWRASLRFDAIPWLLENGSPPIRYRVLTELLGLPRDDQDVQQARDRVMLLVMEDIRAAAGRLARAEGEYVEEQWRQNPYVSGILL